MIAVPDWTFRLVPSLRISFFTSSLKWICLKSSAQLLFAGLVFSFPPLALHTHWMVLVLPAPVMEWFVVKKIMAILFQLLSCMVRLVDSQGLMDVLDNSSFDLEHAFSILVLTLEVDWSKAFYTGWFPSSFTESSADRAKSQQSSTKKEVLIGNCYRQKRICKLPWRGCWKTISFIVTLNHR